MNATQEQYEQATLELCRFIEESPSCYHAIANAKRMLRESGFMELMERDSWEIRPGGKYYVSRNDSSLLSFSIPDLAEACEGFQIISSHSDSPGFKIKENPEIGFEGHYTTLNVEGYGGMIRSAWFDRPLSIAGRVLVREDEKVVTRLLYFNRDMVNIVNLAIHMNRDGNKDGKLQIQKEMLPIFANGEKDATLLILAAEELQVYPKDILGMDLFLVNRMKGTIWGSDNQFYSTPKIDDLQCAYASLQAIRKSSNKKRILVSAIFDNEEVGSGTKQGALSNFLEATMMRIYASLGKTQEEYLMSLSNSFMVSADNGHAIHPNYPEKGDPTNRPYLNGGVLIKLAGNQKYTTDAVSEAIFKMILEKEEIPYQIFTNHSNIPGGSTLGNLANQHVSLNTVDIGMAQLAMHSPYETGGIKDTLQLERAMTAFYQAVIEETAGGIYNIHGDIARGRDRTCN